MPKHDFRFRAPYNDSEISEVMGKIIRPQGAADYQEVAECGESEAPVVFLLDMSKSTLSMFDKGLSRWQIIVREVISTIHNIQSNEIQSLSCAITVAVFNGKFQVICAHVPAFELDVEALKDQLLALRPDGVTAMGKAIMNTLNILRERKEELRRQQRSYKQGCMVLFTDGLPTNENGVYDESTMNEAYAAVDALFKAGKLTVLPIGIMSKGCSPEKFGVLKRLLLYDKARPDDKGPIPVFTDAGSVMDYFRFIGETIGKVLNNESLADMARKRYA